jgi:uncharacterized Zn-finger protein
MRSYIRKRVFWALGVGVGGWLLVMLTGVIATSSNTGAIIALGFLIVFAAALSTRFIKCPKCSTRLGPQVAMHIALPAGRARFNFCPYCGVSLDEAPPNAHIAQTAGQTQNPLNPIK